MVCDISPFPCAQERRLLFIHGIIYMRVHTTQGMAFFPIMSIIHRVEREKTNEEAVVARFVSQVSSMSRGSIATMTLTIDF